MDQEKLGKNAKLQKCSASEEKCGFKIKRLVSLTCSTNKLKRLF